MDFFSFERRRQVKVIGIDDRRAWSNEFSRSARLISQMEL